MTAVVWRRAVELVGWAAVAGGGTVMITQAIGWNGSQLLAALQSLTPYLLPLLVVVASLALRRRCRPLAASASIVGLSVTLLSVPLVFSPAQSAPAVDATPARVASINLLYSNPVVGQAADRLADVDADVIVFTEFTGEHRETLRAHPLADRYPYQINRDSPFANGIAVWSKYPTMENEPLDTLKASIDASVDGPDAKVRLLAVHPPTPIFSFSGWQSDLQAIGDATDVISEPTLVIGDFNASYWHPVFRDLLDRDLTDAHMANGSGWSTSWPTDGLLPAFVRLDHALTGNGLVSTDVDDFDVPGSDHVGLVVSVTPAG